MRIIDRWKKEAESLTRSGNKTIRKMQREIEKLLSPSPPVGPHGLGYDKLEPARKAQAQRISRRKAAAKMLLTKGQITKKEYVRRIATASKGERKIK